MEKLANHQRTMELIRKYDFSFQKRFGQNFLIDPLVLERIMDCAEITEEDFVLEIGPGIGTMTQYLAERARYVVAVEIDEALLPILEETLSGYQNVSVIHADIMKVDLPDLAEKYNAGGRMKVAANLPYYITTPILLDLLEKRAPVDTITVMVQKEVAQRMQAPPGGKDYGALSLAVQYYSKPEIRANVPPNCFVPRPTVGSAVIHLDCRGKPDLGLETDQEQQMFKVIRAAFGQRRKTLANALKNAQNLPYSREEVEEALSQQGLQSTIRGEALSLEQFARITLALMQIHP